MDQFEVNDSLKQAISSIKNFKQGQLLEKSLFTSSYQVSPEIMRVHDEESVLKIIKSELISRLAKEIVSRYEKSITLTDLDSWPGTKAHRLELLVLEPSSLKEIVEFCIRQIPDHELSKIRKTE